MTHVFLLVEGQTEEDFAKLVLCPHLADGGVLAVPLLTGVGQQARSGKGGIRTYAAIKGDVTGLLREHGRRGAAVTTMLDLYGLPTDFPGYVTAAQVADPHRRVAQIEAAFAEDIANDRHFIPYIQVHEFEALLFADPRKIALRYPRAYQAMAAIERACDEFGNPELVDDDAPPSHRLQAALPRYNKLADGPPIAAGIGLPTIRGRCPHFAEWIAKLEAHGAQPTPNQGAC